MLQTLFALALLAGVVLLVVIAFLGVRNSLNKRHRRK
jgi:hypothetical protein